MTTVLRRSGTLLRLSRSRFAEPARFSRSSLVAPSCFSLRCPPGRRTYATVNPGEPEPPKNGGRKDGQPLVNPDLSPEVLQEITKTIEQTQESLQKIRQLKKDGNGEIYADAEKKLEVILEENKSFQDAIRRRAEEGTPDSAPKPAQGFQDLYKDASPLSKAPEPPKNVPGDPALSPLTEAEKKQFESVIAMMTKALPQNMVKEMVQMSEQMKKDGIPKELREELTNLRNGAGFSLATATKLSRIIMKYTREATDRAMDDGEKQKQEKGSSEESTSGQTGQQGRPTPQIPFKKMEFKLDTNFFIVSAFVTYLLYRMLVPSENSREITWQEFRTSFLDKGLVDRLTVINRSRVRVSVHREAVAQVHPESPAVHNNFFYYFTIGSVEGFEGRLEEAQKELGIPSAERIPVAYGHETALWDMVKSFGPTLLLIGFFVMMGRSARGGGGGGANIFSMGRSRAKKFNHETAVKIKFKDVAGMDEAKQEIMEFVSFLKEPGQYQRLGAKIPRGAILSGPPGTGKTLLAKATAGESNVPFFSVSGSEFVEMFVGVGASRVRDLFANARKSTPCIIFIDEIDAIGKSRGKNNFSGGNDEREATLNQILTEMDGFNTTEQVVVLAGTNRPDVLDPALMRPGRFDRHIAIDRPTMDGRKQIFKVHMREIITSEDMDYLCGRLAALTPGFSGADIANCVNEAALIAARGKADNVAMTHFEQAIERIIGGLEKKSLVLNPEEKRTVAYHEAGHAICGWFFKYADPLLKVSIIPRGQGALGYAQYLPAGDTYLLNVNQLMDRMAMTLAGRVSEELHFDTVTSGASDDFKKVTRMAAAMVTKFGMSTKIGYLYFEEEEQRLSKPFSEDTARSIDQEIRRIVDEAYQQCRQLLVAKKKEIGIVAEELLRKEVLGRDDLIRLLGKRPFEDNGEFNKYFGAGKGSENTPPPPVGEILNPEPPATPAMFQGGMGGRLVETGMTSWGAREELFRRRE